VRDAAVLWRLFSPEEQASWPRMVALAAVAVQARHRMSAGLAAAYYGGFTLAEVGVAETPLLAQPLPEERIVASLTATGLVGTIRALSVGQSPQAALQNGFVRFQGSFSRLALTGGRETLLATTKASPRANGYTRIVGGGACAFCADLAGEASAPDAFQAHDNCTCTAEPTFG
jgi:hypothetical protein